MPPNKYLKCGHRLGILPLKEYRDITHRPQAFEDICNKDLGTAGDLKKGRLLMALDFGKEPLLMALDFEKGGLLMALDFGKEPLLMALDFGKELLLMVLDS